MKRYFLCGQHRRPTVTPAEENKRETGEQCIIGKCYTSDALEKLIVTWESSSLHLVIACFIQTALCWRWSRTESSRLHILVKHRGIHMVDGRLLRNSPGSSQRVRYRPIGLFLLPMIEKKQASHKSPHDRKKKSFKEVLLMIWAVTRCPPIL